MIPTDTDFEAQFSLETEATPVPEDPPFHILFMGDYSGRENFAQTIEASLPDFKTLEIDRDNFEDVMKRLNISLRLDLSGEGQEVLALQFRELDDFHPDRIFQQVSLFSDLRDTRKRLLNPDSFESAAREVRAWFEESLDEKAAENIEEVVPNEPASSGSLLDDILTGTKAESTSYKSQVSESTELKSFIKDIVKDHIIQTDEAEQSKLLSVIDEATSELMRQILHHHHFQALESAWRGLYFVVRRTETSNDLKLFLMDISKQEVTEDLKSVSDLTDSKLFQKIVIERKDSMAGEPWALICGNYEFELNVEAVATLIRMAKIGNTLTAPFISQIKPQMLGINSISESPNSSDWSLSDDSTEGKLWTMLRTIRESANLGFTMPRFLSRLPYGEDTEPTEVFSFEEFTGISEHKNYVWANSSFALALLFAQSYRANSWDMGQRMFNEIDGLPTHQFKKDGEAKTKNCAEIDMTHTSCDSLIEQGLMPLISFRNTDSIKFADFQSIAFPTKNLNGRWG